MSETVAQQKFSCPSCGAEATWNPGQQALICGYCGTKSPATLDTTPGGGATIRELDLATALRGIPDDQRGWRTERVEVMCQSCRAISIFDPARIAQRCDFCGAAKLVPHAEVKEPFSPESLLPFKLGATQVRDAVRLWYGRRWFAPNALGTRALTDELHGLYIPYWTFDARVSAVWTAESGRYYFDTEFFTDAQGNRRSRQVRKVRWTPSSGRLEHFFDDELVCASKGLDRRLLRGIEPFPTRELVPYQAGFLAGWVVERYQIDLIGAAQHSREQMEQRLRELCARQVPGDTHRNLQVRAEWSGRTFKHILVPVWLLTYHYHGRRFDVLVNGYTGAIAGTHPKSWIKITLAALGVLLFVLMVVLLGRYL
ncbi:MAG: zinc ribbon domain-containing protein [Verrucomicrobiae bacterium]|nr:zinc ribbon domain-containing protein [Verrucomicrobiae bacterium]